MKPKPKPQPIPQPQPHRVPYAPPPEEVQQMSETFRQFLHAEVRARLMELMKTQEWRDFIRAVVRDELAQNRIAYFSQQERGGIGKEGADRC